MLISHKHKFITIDIPKTGTRSLRESLLPLNIIDVRGLANFESEFYQHDFAIRAKKQFTKNRWNWNEYFKFTIVRNPWARYFSFFKYFKSYSEKYLRRDKSISWDKPETNQGELCVELFKDKDDQTVLKNIILNNHAQDDYYCNDHGEIIVDHIAEFDDIANEFIFFCEKTNINAPQLQHGNKSSNSLRMMDVYNQQLIDLIAEKERNVIELKNYNYHV